MSIDAPISGSETQTVFSGASAYYLLPTVNDSNPYCGVSTWLIVSSTNNDYDY